MRNMAQEVVLIIFAILSIWVIVLSLFLWRTRNHYNRLIRNVTEKNLQSALEQILKEVDANKQKIGELAKHTTYLEKDGLLHAQKVGLLRFNPFKDTGGDQSFILALLDGQDNGVVISSLHSRSGTRWYAKRVKGGKGVEYELSEEEMQAIKEARKHET